MQEQHTHQAFADLADLLHRALRVGQHRICSVVKKERYMENIAVAVIHKTAFAFHKCIWYGRHVLLRNVLEYVCTRWRNVLHQAEVTTTPFGLPVVISLTDRHPASALKKQKWESTAADFQHTGVRRHSRQLGSRKVTHQRCNESQAGPTRRRH